MLTSMVVWLGGGQTSILGRGVDTLHQELRYFISMNFSMSAIHLRCFQGTIVGKSLSNGLQNLYIDVCIHFFGYNCLVEPLGRSQREAENCDSPQLCFIPILVTSNAL